MADPETPSPSGRRAARTQRRGRLRRIARRVGAGLVVLAAVAVALVLTNVIAVPGSTSSRRVSAPPAVSPTTRPSAKPVHRALTPVDPLRLWIAGDSLAGSIGPALGQLTANTGVVQPQYDSRVSSGLLNPNFFDWPQHAAEQLALLDPEVVVFIVGTNDANSWSTNLETDYRDRTLAMMRQLAGNHQRQVLWVGAPVAESKSLETGVLAVDAVQRSAAAKVPGVTYVDAHALFADTKGRYQQSFADRTGKVRVMRADDGVHFSVDGADFVGQAIFDALDASWELTKQTVSGAAKRVLETKGSTQVPGTHRSVGASVSDGSPTTQPPAPGSTSSSSSSPSTASSSTSTSSSSSSPTSTATVPPTTTPRAGP